MGFLAILATQGDNAAFSAALPLLLIGVPIIDTLGVMSRRIRERSFAVLRATGIISITNCCIWDSHIAEAVILAYAFQAVLFLLAYFLRFESDLLVVVVFCAFALTLLFALSWIGRTGWRAHSATEQRASIPLSTWLESQNP